MPAGEQVRRRQILGAELRPVGPAARGGALGLQALAADRGVGRGHHGGELVQVAAHVRVLVADLELQPGARLGRHHRLGSATQHGDMVGQQSLVEVADDGADLGTPGGATDRVDVDEAVAALSRLGRQLGWELGQNAAGQSGRVDKLAEGEAGMYLDALDDHDDLRRGERLGLQLAELGPVDRVRADGTEALDVKQRRAHPDLLVGREADPQPRARQLRVRDEMRHGGHDLRHAGLVVGPEQRVAAGGDDVVPDLAASSGMRSGSSTVPPRGNWITPPSYPRCTIGSTPSPGASGLVSTWAMSPIVGTSPSTVGSSVAKT